MLKIHSTAVVSPDAVLGHDVSIGPYCIVEDNVAIGDSCSLAAHAVVKSGTTLGPDNHIHEGAILGGLPQHVHMPERPGRLEIGTGNRIREHVTLHRALQEDAATVVGNHNLLMAGSHVAHDCLVGDNVIMANNALLAGHVIVQDRAYVSGLTGIHQFCRIGRLAMVGGLARVVKDVPPFVTVDGISGLIVGLNLIGLRRNGFGDEEIGQLKRAYRLIYRSGLAWSLILERLAAEFTSGPAADFTEFFKTGRRGITAERRSPPGATIRLHDDTELPEAQFPAARAAG